MYRILGSLISILSLIALPVLANATEEYTVIDDFESYDGDVNQIDDTWTDGYSYPYNGSAIELQVGPPVHGGGQSMRYLYNNTEKWDTLHYWSEVERIFSDPCDWTVQAVKVLTLWFYGNAGNDANATEQMYVGVKDSNGLYAELRYGDYLQDEDVNDIKEEEWHRWDIGLPHLSDPYYAGVVNDVNLQAVATLYIGFGDRNNTTTRGGDGTVYFDDIRLYPPICKPEYGPTADLNDDCLIDFEDFTVLGSQWKQPPGEPSADVNGPANIPDGVVDWLDLADMAEEHWLEMRLWPE